jgi:hypothetical protein
MGLKARARKRDEYQKISFVFNYDFVRQPLVGALSDPYKSLDPILNEAFSRR